jgi:stage II sporulation protein D
MQATVKMKPSHLMISFCLLCCTEKVNAELPEIFKVKVFGIYAPQEILFSSSGGLRIKAIAGDGKTTTFKSEGTKVRCDETGSLEIGDRKDLTRLEVSGINKSPLWAGVPGRQDPRPYKGWFEIEDHKGKCHVINHVRVDDYVESVSCREINGAGPEALKAQAILVRTWAYTRRGKHKRAGYDFCDLTHCQVYVGTSACTSLQKKHMREVKRNALFYAGRLADVAYFSTCGGHTANAADIWGTGSERPYLKGIGSPLPAACSSSPHFRWISKLGRNEFCGKIKRAFPGAGMGEGCQIKILERGRGGWIKRIRLRGKKTLDLSGEDFHMLMGRIWGWGKIKSANFELQSKRHHFVFVGRGLGHGVGMCQYGAMGMERKGANYLEILKHYFPGTSVGLVP